MTVYVSVDNSEKGKSLFTHFLSRANGWSEAISQPEDFCKVIHLGIDRVDGDVFAVYEDDCERISIYKGTKGSEFNN